jgi:hypothetical protein
VAIITGGKDALGSEFIQGGKDYTGWTRREPLIDSEQLKARFLFGIPMYSAIPDPVSGIRAHLTNEILKDIILRSAARIEFETGVTVLPVQRDRKMPFDRTEYLQLGYFSLPDRPVLKVLKIAVATSQYVDGTNDPQSIYALPNEWVEMGQAQRGQINILPLQPAYLNAGFIPSQGAGGAAFLSILGSRNWIPSFWIISYLAGFDESGLPTPVNDLIGIEAAIDVLNMLGATNRIASHSLGVDSISQSVSTPGPQVYQFRIEQLMAQKQMLVNKVKALFQLKIHTSNV